MDTVASPGTTLVDEIAQREPDQVSAGGSRTWSVRGRNHVVAITELVPGDRLQEHGVAEEHVLLVQGEAELTVTHGEQASVHVSEPALVIVPAGTSSVTAASSATVVRVFSARCAEQMRRAVNHAAGVDQRAAVAPRPPATGGSEVRVHLLRDVPVDEGRLGRVFRTSSLMVNWFPLREGPRDTEQLSPHAHADFEQLSVTLVGDHAHHLRVPWTARMSEWREDEHVRVGSPSMTLIPPTVEHTTHAVGAGPHVLVDVFAPPRQDFLDRGWVLNAGDYPEAGR